MPVFPGLLIVEGVCVPCNRNRGHTHTQQSDAPDLLPGERNDRQGEDEARDETTLTHHRDQEIDHDHSRQEDVGEGEQVHEPLEVVACDLFQIEITEGERERLLQGLSEVMRSGAQRGNDDRWSKVSQGKENRKRRR